MENKALSLGTLPLDILTYLVYDCIEDGNSLQALSLTCHALRNLAFRRICSEKVTLNLNLPGYTELQKRNAVADSLTLESQRSIGLTKRLFVNINSLECQDHIQSEEYQRLVTNAERIVERCPAVEVATVRECSGMNKAEILNVIQWSNAVVKLPKLRFLFIDPYERRQFKSRPDDQYIARIENLYAGKQQTKGLECLSVQSAFNGIHKEELLLQSPFLQKTLLDNIGSLTRLWFLGAELQEAIKEMPTACLASMRLKSLSIRHLESHSDFVRVFGLRLRADRRRDGSLAKEDTATNLEYLYLGGQDSSAEGELQLLRYLHTPKLKSLQLGVGMIDLQTEPEREERLLHDYLESLTSLERFGTTNVQERSKAPYLALLNQVLASQPHLKTLATWGSWYAFNQLMASKSLTSGSHQSLEKIEMSTEADLAEQGLFRVLGLVIRTQSSSRSSVATLSIGQTFWEQRYFGPREICVIISTILYVHQKRIQPKKAFTAACSESQTSPLVETPARRALYNFIAGKRSSWLKPFMSQSSQQSGIEKYLHTLMSTLPPGKQKWTAKLAEWDTSGQASRLAVINGISDAVNYDLHEGFKRLELEWRAHNVGRGWPKDRKDWRFVWEKTAAGWELLEYV
ncbi:hypothetical protein TWF481_010940 [Arthrobotrys musiformis]|uniref:F-box domain-containing protein n=1 Tax=Arthrobotrys musiformis TaxID=47236 RepID=A0AAV9VWY0_9PEZI